MEFVLNIDNVIRETDKLLWKSKRLLVLSIFNSKYDNYVVFFNDVCNRLKKQKKNLQFIKKNIVLLTDDLSLFFYTGYLLVSILDYLTILSKDTCMFLTYEKCNSSGIYTNIELLDEKHKDYCEYDIDNSINFLRSVIKGKNKRKTFGK